MRLPATILSLLVLAVPTVVAGSQTREQQVSAATVAARQRLAEELAGETVGSGWSVGDWFERMGAIDRLDELIASAEPVGGARWLDEWTCQVRVQLLADRVAELILNLALAAPHRTPVPYGTLETRLRGWQRRSFSATGTSTTWERAVELSPPASVAAWRDVPPSQARSAVLAAREDLAARFVGELSSAGQDDPRIAAALSDETRRRALTDWVERTPVTGVHWREGPSVEISVPVPAETIAREAGIEARLPAMISGRGAAAQESPAGAYATGQQVFMPESPPKWSNELVDAEGVGAASGSALRSARAAEASAINALRGRVAQLQWGAGTIGDAVPTDPSLADAVERALASARVARVEYLADGSVRARMTLSGRRLWQEIAAASERPPVPSR